MSNWTHVAAVARICYVPFLDGPAAPCFENIFGKELLWESPEELWEEADEHPERFLPLGSEGSLRMTVWENPDKCQACQYTITIFGDLRSYERAQDVVDWFKEKLKECGGYDNVRNAAITATNDYGPSASWALNDL